MHNPRFHGTGIDVGHGLFASPPRSPRKASRAQASGAERSWPSTRPCRGANPQRRGYAHLHHRLPAIGHQAHQDLAPFGELDFPRNILEGGIGGPCAASAARALRAPKVLPSLRRSWTGSGAPATPRRFSRASYAGKSAATPMASSGRAEGVSFVSPEVVKLVR